MPTLTIRDFSCIDDAEVKVSKFTVLIGAQAAGKSVISKLSYFFYDVLIRQFDDFDAERGPIEDFSNDAVEMFKRWFPPSAWGKKRFTIQFHAGQFSVEINRARIRDLKSDRINLEFSDYFIDSHDYAEKLFSDYRAKAIERNEGAASVHNFEVFWQIRKEIEQKIKDDIGEEYPGRQLFVPAGRSFFTSVGKAVSAFELGGTLDPLTLRFGKLFTAVRESCSLQSGKALETTCSVRRHPNQVFTVTWFETCLAANSGASGKESSSRQATVGEYLFPPCHQGSKSCSRFGMYWRSTPDDLRSGGSYTSRSQRHTYSRRRKASLSELSRQSG
jgi:hypothetical protein